MPDRSFKSRSTSPSGPCRKGFETHCVRFIVTAAPIAVASACAGNGAGLPTAPTIARAVPSPQSNDGLHDLLEIADTPTIMIPALEDG